MKENNIKELVSKISDFYSQQEHVQSSQEQERVTIFSLSAPTQTFFHYMWTIFMQTLKAKSSGMNENIS